MNIIKTMLDAALFAVALLAIGVTALAQEATIRKNLAERVPQLQAIDEITKSPMPGLWEVRVNGTEILYTDAEGNFIIQGSLIDTKQRRNLTEERIDKLTAVAFDSLPLKDAVVIKQGTGARRQTDEAFAAAGLPHVVRFEVNLMELVERFVRHGLAVGIVPGSIAEGFEGVVRIPLQPAPRRHVHLVWQRLPMPAARAFVEAVLSRAGAGSGP